MTEKVDDIICVSKQWPEEMRALRRILLDCGLGETIKWGKPCYTHDGRNIVIMQEMKAFLALMFFKGALLDDPRNVLREQGPHSRSARRMEFTSVEEIERQASVIYSYVGKARRVEASGTKVAPKPELVLVAELSRFLEQNPRHEAAFKALTPGRQREYNLHISAAKQTSTRHARIEKWAAKILDGKGMRE